MSISKQENLKNNDNTLYKRAAEIVEKYRFVEMNYLLNFLFSVFLLATVSAVSVSKSPFSSGNEQVLNELS